MNDFVNPLFSPLFVRIGKALWPYVLRTSYQVSSVKVLGGGLKRFASLREQRTIICPNHPTAADPDVMFQLSNLVKEDFRYLAAREVFRSSHGLYGIILRLAGCYSVRRGVVDRPSYRAVSDALALEPHKFVIFPEGELSHQFETLMPLEPGVCQLGFWALERMRNLEQKNSPIYLLPVAISYAYDEDPRYYFDFALSKIEDKLDISGSEGRSENERLKCICAIMLEVLEAAYKSNVDTSASEDCRLIALRRRIVHRLCNALGLRSEKVELDTIHALRDQLDHIDSESGNGSQYAQEINRERCAMANLLLRDFHRIMNLRFCLNKSSGTYAYQGMGEALYLLEQEILGSPLPSAQRTAVVAVGEPIKLNEFLPLYKDNRHNALAKVNGLIGKQLLTMQADVAHEVSVLEAQNINARLWKKYHKSEATLQRSLKM